MNTELNELEAKLQKLFNDGGFNDTRAIFEIGIEFGQCLQQYGIQSYEPAFWKRLDEERNKERAIREAVEAINKFLLVLVQKSIKDYVTKNGSWSIAKGSLSSEYEEFDAGTTRKYCVQIIRVDMTQYGGDFECTFKVVGRLAKLFKKHKIYEQFEVTIDNDSGDEHTSINRVERVSNRVSHVHCYAMNSNNWELDQYKDFLQVISKDFVFCLMED